MCLIPVACVAWRGAAQSVVASERDTIAEAPLRAGVSFRLCCSSVSCSGGPVCVLWLKTDQGKRRQRPCCVPVF